MQFKEKTDCDNLDSFVNTLSLYTLTPGVTSSFRDIRICDGLCDPLDRGSGKTPATHALDKDGTDPFKVFDEENNFSLPNFIGSFMLLNLIVVGLIIWLLFKQRTLNRLEQRLNFVL